MSEFDLETLVCTRLDLQRVATHVLARRRHAVSGRFGLRATPGGFGTPAFGEAIEVLRVSGMQLVREVGGDASFLSLGGACLADLAAFAGADLTRPFDAGPETPPLGDAQSPLAIDPDAAATLADWFGLGWRAVDAAGGRGGVDGGSAARPSVLQLWPEHFDAGCSVAVGRGADDRCNLGVSPGDGSSDEPYLYVGPWGPERPGDPTYWNAPFGAVLPRSAVLRSAAVGSAASLATAVAFFRRGLSALGVVATAE